MRMSRPLLLACVAGALMTAGAGTAHAAPSGSPAQRDGDVGAQAACTASNVGVYTERSGGQYVHGYGGFFNCTGYPYATIRLQRHRWFGWETLRQWSGTFVPGLFESLWYFCPGTGTHTYRTVLSHWSGTRYSREFRTTC